MARLLYNSKVICECNSSQIIKGHRATKLIRTMGMQYTSKGKKSSDEVIFYI